MFGQRLSNHQHVAGSRTLQLSGSSVPSKKPFDIRMLFHGAFLFAGRSIARQGLSGTPAGACSEFSHSLPVHLFYFPILLNTLVPTLKTGEGIS